MARGARTRGKVGGGWRVEGWWKKGMEWKNHRVEDVRKRTGKGGKPPPPFLPVTSVHQPSEVACEAPILAPIFTMTSNAGCMYTRCSVLAGHQRPKYFSCVSD